MSEKHVSIIREFRSSSVSFDLVSGDFAVPEDRLAHSLALAKVIKSADVPASASGYTYYGAYIRFLREFETVIAARSAMLAESNWEGGEGA